MRSRNRLLVGVAGAALAASSAVVVVAGPANATTPTGGCWVYSPSNPSDVEDTVPASSTSTSLAAWTDSAAAPTGDADYTLTTTGSTVVGGTRNFSLTFTKGPKNGGPPASGTAYYYFSVGGTNLPVVTKAFSAPGANVIPGDTVTGSYTISAAGSQAVRLRKVIYDIPTFTLRVGCNGQTSGTASVNPATTPTDTNIVSSSFTASGPTATISAISNQVVTTHARKGDVVSFGVTDFASGTATAEICSTTGTACDAGGSTFTIAGGTGSGTVTLAASPTTGARALKVTSGSDVSLTPLTVLANPTISTNLPGGGAGSVVTVTGSGWDPNQSVTISATKSGPPFPPGATSDPGVVVTASASGAISGNFTVNDPTTAFIGASRTHAAGPPPVVIFASAGFTFSGDTCTAKVGAAATGSCALLQTVRLSVTAGDLKLSKVAGDVVMSAVSLDGTEQTSTGSLQDVTVEDYRGGSLGWSLTGRFSGLTGPVAIGADKLSWTPSCTADANNDDTVTTGAAGAFVDSATAMPLCSVGTAGLGADGTSGGDTAADAALELALGASQAAGTYTGTITLTLS